jgi:hypothetical protein
MARISHRPVAGDGARASGYGGDCDYVAGDAVASRKCGELQHNRRLRAVRLGYVRQDFGGGDGASSGIPYRGHHRCPWLYRLPGLRREHVRELAGLDDVFSGDDPVGNGGSHFDSQL